LRFIFFFVNKFLDIKTKKKTLFGFAEYARSFRSLCDQLSAIGKSVDDTDKVHWFLYGLGSDLKKKFTPMLSQLPLPSFANLVRKALSHEFFLDHSLVILPISRLWLFSVAIFLDVQNMPLMHGWPASGPSSKTCYIDPQFPSHVCRLQGAFYGLKHAPHAWFQRFSQILPSIGFAASSVDSSLFIYLTSVVIYLILYVDDMIIIRSKQFFCAEFYYLTDQGIFHERPQ